jgi:oligopeptide transport system substrate-binding protein
MVASVSHRTSENQRGWSSCRSFASFRGMLKRRLQTAGFLFAALTLASCSGSDPAGGGIEETSVSSGRRPSLRESLDEVQAQAPLERRFDPLVRIQFTADPVSLDPSLAEDGLSLRILNNMMEGLVRIGPEGELQPALARSWDFRDDGRTIEFELRPQARWSDGRTVRAADFVTGMRRSLSPEFSGKLSPFLLPIKNAAKVLAGKLPPARLGVEAHASNGIERVRIRLAEPSPWLLQALTLPVAFPQREDILRGSGGKWNDRAPVTGEYRIVDRRIDRSIRLEPNPEYWAVKAEDGYQMVSDPRLPIVIQVIQDESTALNLFETGDIDVLTRIPLTELQALKAAGRLRTDPFLATYFLGFNLTKAPFRNKAARRAVSAAIRRAEIAMLLDGGERPAWSWIPPTLEGAQSERDSRAALEEASEPGLAAAKKALAGSELELSIDSGSRNALIAEKIQEDLKKSLGLRVKITTRDWKSHIREMATDPAPLFRFGWMAPFADPITHLKAFTSGDPNNYGGFRSRKYDELVGRISALAPGFSRSRLIEQADRMLVSDEAVLVPIYFYSQNHAISPRVRGFRANPYGTVRFSELRVQSDEVQR